MSQKVKERLTRQNIETTHEERREIDRVIEERTGLPCDEGVTKLSETEFLYIVGQVKKRLRKKEPIQIYA